MVVAIFKYKMYQFSIMYTILKLMLILNKDEKKILNTSLPLHIVCLILRINCVSQMKSLFPTIQAMN